MKLPNPLDYPIYSIGLFMVLLGFGYQGYRLFDQGFLKQKTGVGHVNGHEYKPMSQSTYTTKVGNSVHSYPVQVPDAWLLGVEVEGATGQATVSQSTYEAIQDGDSVDIVYSRRRLSGGLTIHSLLPIKKD